MNKKQLTKFAAFIGAAGAQVLSPTNEWEVLRFRANDKIGVVYKNKSDALNFVGEAEAAYHAYVNKISWSACEKVSRVKKNIVFQSIIDRDGNECFYCKKDLLKDAGATVEHLFSINQGGRNHIANLALACEPCNKEASHLSVVEKVKLREAKTICQKN